VNESQTFLAPGDTFEALTEAECRTLLSTRTFGRVGVTSGGLPVILPVRYSYADDTITFRSGRGTKLRAAQNGDVLAFEVDAYDPETGDGWSVLVLGRATVVGAPAGSGAANGETANGVAHDVRLNCELVTGRLLVH
jgi:nitroimidazol reductase NimA-like FMN-containing flavoprotein (pyridoxamine 5'-phosphate oxidase superfamily)